jgi:hypothetical protein
MLPSDGQGNAVQYSLNGGGARGLSRCPTSVVRVSWELREVFIATSSVLCSGQALEAELALFHFDSVVSV